MKYRLLIVTTLFYAFSFAQNSSVYNEKEIIELADLAKVLKQDQEANKNMAIARAEELNLPLRVEYDNGEIIEVRGIMPSGALLYNVTDNLDAAKTVSTDKVWPGGSLGFALSGGSVGVGEWDGGGVRLSHRELTSRVTQGDIPSGNSDHATHVAGTMIASGVTPTAKGMAYTADLDAFDWNSDNSEMTIAASKGMLVSNHSYGTITGWRYNSGLARHEWWGDTTISTSEDYKFGFYNSTARAWDQIAEAAPYYLIVKSAGNDRGDNHSGAHFLPYYNVTSSASRPQDGGATGYDCISTSGNAKNILTVGAVNAITGGYSDPNDVVMSSFSGWGPTDDGRIKPDIVANGVGVYSSLATNDSAYASYNGTSMAAPNTTGSLVLIQQHHQNVKSSYMKAATLKGLVIHTADEAGTNVGPDYQHGWGLLNTARAVEHISNISNRDQMIETSLNNSQTYTLNVTSDGLTPLRATICWTDIAGTSPSAQLDPSTKMLVNDLDLRITRDANSAVTMPFVLNPASPSSGATTGDNTLDNVEQVLIETPTAGSYTISVSHKGTLSSSQDFSLLVSGGIAAPTPIACGQTIDIFPYSEDFETFTNCSNVPASSCLLPALSGWTNISTDSIDWTTFSGSTGTSNTGPSMDFNPGTASGKYLYLEATGAGNSGVEGILIGPCFDIDLISSPELSFAYHMEGTDMGSLSVDVNTGISWTNIWFMNGDQGSGWKKAYVDLTAFAGDTIQIRFRGITGNGQLSDMAIDDIEIKSNPFSCNLTISSFPYQQDFESFSTCSTAPASSCVLLSSSGYVNESTDNIDWTTNSGSTTSAGTGPTTDYNPGTISGKYLYTEASTSGTGFPNMEAIITGPCFELASLNQPELSFAYHMYGGDMGILYVEVDSGAGWTTIWTLSGDQGDTWYQTFVDLTVFKDTKIQIRLRGVTGTGYESDIAIDNIKVDERSVRVYCASNALNTNDSHISNVTLNNLNNSTSNCTGFSDFTNMYTKLRRDSTYNLSITTGDCDGGGAYQHAVAAYIDWNYDGSFNTNEEQVLMTTLANSTTNIVPITVPSNASQDTLMMRVIVSETLPISSCGTYDWGETEDYALIITAGPSNDSCGGAIALQCGSPILGTTIGAAPDPTAINCGTNVDAPGVWYKAIGNGQQMQVDLCGPATNYDTRLNVYSGTCGAFVCETGNDNSCGNSSSVNWNSTAGVTYYIFVQGTSNATGDFEIALSTAPTSGITAATDTTFCDGDSVSLMADLANSYQWLLNSSNIPGATSQNYIAKDSGVYQVITTDANACSDTTSNGKQVTVIPAPVVTISNSGPTTFCDGGNVVLSTPTIGSTYQWYKDGIAIPSSSFSLYNVDTTGIYNVLVTDANTCADSAASGVQVTVHPRPVVNINASGPTTFCEGENVTLSVTGGVSYQWYYNNVALPGATNPSFLASNSGDYNVIVQNANSCSDSAANAVTLTENPVPVANVTTSGSTSFCDGDSVVLTASGGMNYQWFKDGVLIASATNTTFSAKTSGLYNVLAENGNNCSDSLPTGVTVTVNSLPVVSISNSGPTTFCANDSVVLSTVATGSYQWYLNGSTIASANGSSYAAKQSGNYNVLVTDANTCADSASVGSSVTVNSLPVVSITNNGPTTFCDRDSVTLNTATVGSYQWHRNGSTISGATSGSYIAKSTGIYNVVVTDGNNCEDSANTGTAVVVNSLPVVNISSNGITEFCDKDSAQINVTTAGVYQWTKNGQPILNETAASIFVKESGIYNTSVTDGNNCTDTASVGIAMTKNPLPVIGLNVMGNSEFCDGDSVVIGATGANQYSWYRNGIILPDTGNQYTAYISGAFNVLGTDLNGCMDSATVAEDIVVNDLPNVQFSAVNPLCNTITSYILTEGTPAGGIYSGTGISSDSIFDPQSAGVGMHWITYTYIDPVTSCENMDSIEVEVVNCVGITESASIKGMVIYPNPAKEEINIRFNNIDGQAQLRLLGLDGKELMGENRFVEVQPGHYKLRLDEIAAGLYMLQVRLHNKTEYHKIVLQ